jgi:glucose/arabinose dehydrogenase
MKKLLLLAGLLSCSDAADTGAAPAVTEDAAGIRLVEVASGLSSPVFLTAPSGDARNFIVEQTGRIRILKNGAVLTTPFLDIHDRVTAGGEQGLLSVAFHPDYATNGYFYVDYTDRNGDTRIERYHVGSNPDIADPASAKLLLQIDQPYANHNGGLVMFGPDRMLYIGMGDGGSGGDPQGNGQNRNALLGKILRIDVDRGDPYAIPSNNPYATAGGAKEVWATGMRNPWRFSFDATAGLLIIADVGQNAWEEIDAAPVASAGLNYGWNTMEGTHCYRTAVCSRGGLTLPILEYSHSDGCSITGGYVYRGRAMPSLAGTYFYADYCQGWIRSIRITNGQAANPTRWTIPSIGSITSFGLDSTGELYVLTSGGKVYRMAAST